MSSLYQGACSPPNRMMSGTRSFASISIVLLLFILCADAAGAEQGPLMRVAILPDLIPGVARQLLPMTIELPGDHADSRSSRIKIVGLIYCGGDRHGGANALAEVYPYNAAIPSSALSQTDCKAALNEIAQRLAGSPGAPDWVEVIRTDITWVPWELKFAMLDAAGAGKGAKQAPSLKGVGQFQHYLTSNLQILSPPGQNYRFDLAIGFLDSTIVVALFPAGRGVANPQPYPTADPLLNGDISSAPAGANVLAEAQYAFINDLLKMYAPSYSIPIELQGMTQTMVAKNVRLSGKDRTITAAGQLSLENFVYNATVRCDGDDLSVSAITLEPLPSNCDVADMVERLQCQAQQAAMAGSSSAAAAALTSYYQGQKFHYSSMNSPLQFTLGDAEFAATFEALKSSSRDATFSEAGRVMIHRTSATAGKITPENAQ